MLIRSKASQDSLQEGLSDLKAQVGRAEVTVCAQRLEAEGAPAEGVVRIQDVDKAKEDIQVSKNLELFVRAIENFHSSASTVISEGIGSTLWDGSAMGDPLSEEKHSRIENWIPPTIDEMPAAEADLEAAQFDSDGEVERDLALRLEELALDKQRKGDAAGAEDLFRKAIERGESIRRPSQDIESMKLELAYTYICQAKWEEARVIVLPIAVENKSRDLRALHSLHALAIAYVKLADLETAYGFALRALAGKERLLGKAHPSCWDTQFLLASICDSRGDKALAEAHRSFIPSHHRVQSHGDPLSYMLRSTPPRLLPKHQDSAAKRGRTPKRFLKRPLQTPQNTRNRLVRDTAITKAVARHPAADSVKHVVVGIDFGNSQTVVAFGFLTPDKAVNIVMDQLPGTSLYGNAVVS